LRRLPGKDNIRLIVMDLSETYRNIARQHFPRARIIADRFHVIRLLLLKNLRKKRAQQKLPELLTLIEQLRHTPLRRLAKTLTSLARAHRHDVAIQQEQWTHRGLPQ